MRGEPESPTQSLAVFDAAQNILLVNKSPPLASSQFWLLIFRIVPNRSSFETGPNNCNKRPRYYIPLRDTLIRKFFIPGSHPNREH